VALAALAKRGEFSCCFYSVLENLLS